MVTELEVRGISGEGDQRLVLTNISVFCFMYNMQSVTLLYCCKLPWSLYF